MVENESTEGYFAFVESVEFYRFKNRFKNLIRFDIFHQKWLTVLQNSGSRINSILPEISTQLLEIELSINDLYSFSGLAGRRIREGRWYIIKLSPSAGQPGLKAYTFNDPTIDVSNEVIISDIILLDTRDSITKSLEKIVSLDSIHDAGPNTIKKAIERPTALPVIVACYNVGQGNCNAVCNKQGIPLVYFDFGGGINRNAQTYPKQMRFCLSARPAIILSHWDIDHWSSGLRFPDSHNCVWIAPRQSIGMTHKKFAEKLNSKGNLLIWPDTINSVGTKFGDFIKLPRNQKRNFSGIVMFANTNDVATDGKTFKAITLLPGDSPYKIIPNINNRSLNGLVASHHGGNYIKDQPPTANSIHTIAYSYGNGNSYGHPSITSIIKHIAAGWTYHLNTPKGHIALGMAKRAVPLKPCPNICDLQLVQA